jgi:hypothetical protein
MIPRTGARRAGTIAGAVATSFLPVLGGLEGCANAQAPRGGPPDTIPPILVAVLPESLSVNPGFKDEVRFEFHESLSERNIQTAATLFPFEARPRVKKDGREVRVRPRAGWVSNRIYHVQVEPVVQDLFNNSIRQPIRHVFSTGVPIPTNRVQGSVYDRITGREMRGARFDMIHLPDTLRYGTDTDSVGGFALGWLPLGDFFAIGYEDLNGNRKADAFDRADTIPVSLTSTDTLSLEFQVFKHDTLGPQVFVATALDSIVFLLEFDGYLDPDEPIGSADIQLVSADDSVPIAVDTVLHAWQYRSWDGARIEAARAAADSARAAADSARADSLRAVADTLGAVADTAAALPDTLPPDTLAQPPAPPVPAEQEDVEEEPEEPEVLPDRRIYVVTAAVIPPGTYRVIATGILNLSGLRGTVEGDFEQPEPEEPEEPADPEDPGEPGAANHSADATHRLLGYRLPVTLTRHRASANHTLAGRLRNPADD